MEQIRSFIAIELPAELKLKIGQLQDQLKSGQSPRIKWADPDSIHLTLKFLGNITIDRTSEITIALEEAAKGTPHFQLKVKDPWAFPNLKRVQIVWVGISGEVAQLSRLQQRIESSLAPLGFTPEPRPFSPHLTLARIHNQASPDERQKLGQLIANTKFEADYTIMVNTVSLMKSQLTRMGAIYSRVSSITIN